MRVCARCLYPESHPLGIVFDDEGVCSGCRVHEEKDRLDWAARRQRLVRLLASYRNRGGTNFDCVVPVSGARDSYFIVHALVREFGMNPLLVNYNRHYNTHRGHRNLAYLRTIFDCDVHNVLPSADLVKRITRRTLDLKGSIYWHCLAGQTVWPVQVAVRYKIPLIVWGAHQGLDQVGMFSHEDEVEMSRRYRKDHDLMGLEAEDLVAEADGLPERDLSGYFYPNDKDVEAVGVRGIYLGNFLRWDSKAQHEAMIARYGYETARLERTFDTYNDVDCVHYAGLHDWIKLVKHGYGKALDHACRELRLKRLSRAQAARLAQRYADPEPPADLDLFLDWIGLDRKGFLATIDRHRAKTAWEQGADGAWRLKAPIWEIPAPANAAAVRLGVAEPCRFRVTRPRDRTAREDRYYLLERGFVDGAPPKGMADGAARD